MKAAVAGELFAARQIFKPEFSFRFTGKITMATNVRIKLTSSPALRHRVQTLVLRQRFEDDRTLYDAVIADAPRVLGMAIERCTAILRGAETFWLPASWQGNRERFERIRRRSEQRFVLIDPINATVRGLLEKATDGHVATVELFRRVRNVLEELAADNETDEAIVTAAALSERELAVQVSKAMRAEFGITSTPSSSCRVYRRVRFRLKPKGLFVDD